MELRTVDVVRYVAPLREGGSLPALVEADDLGTYVLKFTGAGQGVKALVAEVVVGELARALGLPVPELVLARLDPRLAPGEPDEEVQALLRASAGLNLGMDFLPGSLGFDPAVDPVEADLAARVLWLDALTLDVDRSWRNPNLLRWHGRLWLIDHGAALYPHHDWSRAAGAASAPYPTAAEHVLLGRAGPLAEAHAALAPSVPAAAAAAAAAVPDAWLADDAFAGPDEVRAAYVDLLARRAADPGPWLEPLEELRRTRGPGPPPARRPSRPGWLGG